MTPSERLRRWLAIRGWSVREFARRTGLNTHKAYRIVRGDQVPKVDEWEHIAATLGVTMVEWYTDGGAPRPPG